MMDLILEECTYRNFPHAFAKARTVGTDDLELARPGIVLFCLSSVGTMRQQRNGRVGCDTRFDSCTSSADLAAPTT